jgi:hypothetical protein
VQQRGSDGDQHHLLPALRRRRLELDQAAILRLELERYDATNGNGHVNGAVNGAAIARDPVDAVRLRGIPVVGPSGVSGAIHGSLPHVDAIENVERRR